jgi:hypothetical protein
LCDEVFLIVDYDCVGRRGAGTKVMRARVYALVRMNCSAEVRGAGEKTKLRGATEEQPRTHTHTHTHTHTQTKRH